MGNLRVAMVRSRAAAMAIARRVKGRRWVGKDRTEYEQQRARSAQPDDFPITRMRRIYTDRHGAAGEARGHYFHQDLLVAGEIFRRNPRRHIDVGSRIDGFVAHVASFRAIEVFDVRPLKTTIPNVTFVEHDITTGSDESADSVSCLHALEHFGLGRYGDPVDYDGWRNGLCALFAMVEPGGVLYVSVPTGEPQRVEFNDERVFTLPRFRSEVERFGTVEQLAFVTDSGELLPSVDPHSEDAEHSFGASRGLSIWIVGKPAE